MTNAILSALGNGAIAGALLAGTVRAGLWLVPARTFGAAARYAVWWTALVAAALMPLAYWPARTAVHPDMVSRRAADAPVAMPRADAARRLTPLGNESARDLPIRFPLVLTVGGGWPRWIAIGWGAWTGLLFLRLLASCLMLEGRKAGGSAAPEELAREVEASLVRRGSVRRAAVLRSVNLGTPVLAGLRRPAILIPERLFGELTAEELTQIALHEAAHLARRDDYAVLAARFVEAALPWNPALRWIARRIDFERELACDDFVLENNGAPRSYAACLLRVMELSGGAWPSWAATGVEGRRSQLSRRVERLLDGKLSAAERVGKARLLAAIAMVGLLAWVGGRTPRAIALAAPPPVPPQLRPTAPPQSRPTSPPSPAPKPPPAQAPAAPRPPVVLPITVQDRAHRSVAGLGRQSFRVYEDGIEQTISAVTEENPPLTVELVVDQSGSMAGKQRLVDAAVGQLVQAANPADEFFIVTFNDEVDVAGTFDSDAGQILNQLHRKGARGGTSLRDAMLRAVEWTGARYPDRMLVVLSDGVDNSSSERTDDLRDAVLAAKTPVWAITLASAPYPRRESVWLGELADRTMGHEFVSDDAAQAAGFAASIANQANYVLVYQSSNQARDGKFRRVSVDVVDGPAGTLEVHSRAGYYPGGR